MKANHTEGMWVSCWFYCFIHSPSPIWRTIDLTEYSSALKKRIKQTHRHPDRYWELVSQALISLSRCSRSSARSIRLNAKSKYPYHTHIMDHAIYAITYHCVHLDELEESTLLHMIQRLKNIKRYYFKGTSITSNVLRAIADQQQCELMEVSAQGKNETRNSWMKGLPFDSESFLYFGEKCKETLRVLRLKRTSFHSPEALYTLFSICRKLERVSAGISAIDDKAIEILVKNNPQMTHLKISLSKVSDRGLKAIASRCKNLVHLDAKFNEGTTAQSLTILTRGVCKKIQILSIYLPSVPPKELPNIIESFPDLIRLDLAQSLLDDDTLKEIAARKPKLYSLNVSETDLRSLINFENLIELSIGLEKVSDAATRIIPRSCPKLRILRIHQQSFSEGAISSMIE
ncbi:hypothetical protein PROFUN_16694, partial [Planoprotostelium fungivorum]